MSNPPTRRSDSTPSVSGDSETTLDYRSDVPVEIRQLRARLERLESQNRELQRANRQLASSRDRYRDLYDHSPIGIVAINQAGVVLEANRTAAELLELTCDSLLGTQFSQHVVTADQQRWLAHCQGCCDSDQRQTIELTLTTAMENAVVVRLESVVDSGLDPSSRLHRIAIINETERSRARRMLEVQSERLIAFLNNSAVLAWMKDQQGRYVFLSDNYARRFSCSIEDMRGKTDNEIWPHQIAAKLRANDDLVRQTERSLEVLEEIIDSEGVRSWWSSHKFLCNDQLGNQFVGGLAVDMTEREQALHDLHELNDHLERQVELRTTEAIARAMELEESQLNFRGVLDAVPDAIISLSSEGTIIGVNQATERIFGYVSSELVGKSVTLLVPSFSQPSRWSELGRDTLFATEQNATHRDGSIFPVDIRTNPIGDHQLIVAIIRDISTRKALEKQVVDAASEEQRRIGHDIHDGMGQELTGLRYMAQTHAEALSAGQLNSTESDYVKVARRMSDWLETIQGQMRTIIRQLVPVELDQQGLVAALSGLAERTAEINDVTCTFECDRTCTVRDPGLATQLFRIVQEAVNNAVRHSQAKLIKIVLEESGSTLEVRVIDNGVGIENSPTRPSQHSTTGTGIGLNTMAYRAGLINARLQIGPGEQVGTVVRCSVGSDREFSNR